ncbi:MAG: 2-hydroxyacyl-CoA dehydratase [Candidatus Tectomicrobia bacterium]|uniref:2-hydroxyacyl-CoA dehydratase n=1 Tax=Tectimicrobiota bacterium TaxID=2528274 RepID=A0A932FYZ2_UNCTE|nr:2-hydroxyacyl-CoA dehydratase [Candidatus Tectomicrobia bacterium]
MTGSTSKLDAIFQEVDAALRGEAIAHWKGMGKKVVGWLCTYTPEEILYAAGMLPIRIRGNPSGGSLGDTYLQSNMCPYARSCIGEAVEGHYGFLDGLVAVHTCDAICKLYDVWRIYAKSPASFILDHPHKASSLSDRYHRKQLEKFLRAVEEWAGRPVTEAALEEAMTVYRENRALLRRLYHYRRWDFPPLRGSEILRILEAGTQMPKEEHNRLLRQLLEVLESRPAEAAKEGPQAVGRGPRLVISGSLLEGPELLQIIEESGGVVVSDDLCTGTRYFWDEIPPEGRSAGEESGRDRQLAALNRYYMDKIPCACMHLEDRRLQHLLRMVKEFDAQGVILYGLIFCDTFGYDFVEHRKQLEEAGIPVLQLETDYSSQALGQLKTRIQAFLEMIGRG